MLRATGITKKYNRRTIIDNLSFSVEKGETVTLMAPSGSGKTTLFAILAGIDRDFSGTVATRTRNTGVVFQDPGLFWYKTVQENIAYPLGINKIPWCSKTEARYREWMAVTGLAGFEGHYPHEISRGMKQKSAIIRTFLCNPELVFMDEPFSSMDQASARSIVDHIHALHPRTTLVLASHSSSQAAGFSGRVFEVTATPMAGFKITTP
ncbi:MAG: ATP-binding cassette domain-containing protein [Desulfobacteraceae bacterium]|nr:ATP-binding cassette domain-containing protein [Desulfobacteraceae bacterium]